MHRMHKRPAGTVAERKCYAFPDAITKTPRRLSRQRDMILTTAKHSFAARRHTELNRLRLNAVQLGDSPELPRLSSRGFRCEKHPRRRLAADKICRAFHALRVGLRLGTFVFSADRIHAVSLCTLHADSNAKKAKLFAKIAKTLSRKPSTLRPLRASLCDLCVFCQSNSRYSSFHSKHWL